MSFSIETSRVFSNMTSRGRPVLYFQKKPFSFPDRLKLHCVSSMFILLMKYYQLGQNAQSFRVSVVLQEQSDKIKENPASRLEQLRKLVMTGARSKPIKHDRKVYVGTKYLKLMVTHFRLVSRFSRSCLVSA